MTAWKILVARITFFPSPPALPLSKALEIYQQVWGGNPDNYQSSLTANAFTPSFANGKKGDVVVGCSVLPTRVDFTISPPTPPPEDASQIFSLIDNGKQVRSEFEALISYIRGARLSNFVSRVGITVQFLHLAPTVTAANQVLLATIPKSYRTQITNEEDFIFQINQPRTSSALSEVRLNRIVKWSVDRFKLFNVTIGPNLSFLDPQSIPAQPGVEFIGASVTFDINNVPVLEALRSEQQALLLSEAFTAASEFQREIDLNVGGF